MMYEPRLCGTPGQINSDSGQFKFIEVDSMLVAKNKFGATVALQTVYDWAVANQTSFWGRHQGSDTDPRTPIHGWAGAWKSKDWNYIAYIEEKLHEILKAGGFDTEAIIKTWLDRDWLQTDKTGRRKHVRINGPRAYCYCIKKSVLDKILKLKMDDDNDE